MQLTRNDIGRFFTKFIIGKPDAYWLWLAGGTVDGYGQFKIGNIKYMAHRIAYQIEYGEFDESMDICHTCDNPPCMNPAHLFAGTRQDNMEDAMVKGRLPKGDNHYNSTISDNDCEQMKRDFAAGGFTYKRLAYIYNTTKQNAWSIINGQKKKTLGESSGLHHWNWT